MAFALDGLVRDPQRRHPVAAFGSAAAALEPWAWRDDRAAGVRYVVWCVGLPTAAAGAAQFLLRRGRVGAAGLAGVTWVTLGGASLRREGRRMAALLRDGDVATRPHATGSSVRARSVEPGRGGARARHRRVGGREHLRRGGRPAVAGRRWRDSPASSATARSIRSMRWWATARIGTAGSAGPQHVSTIWCEPGTGPAHRRSSRASSRRSSAARSGPPRASSGGTAAATRARMPGCASRRSPAHSAFGSVASTPTTDRPSSAGRTATAAPRRWTTSSGLPGCPRSWASRRRASWRR